MSQVVLGQDGSPRGSGHKDTETSEMFLAQPSLARSNGDDGATPDDAEMTPEERSAMLSRVYVLEPGIVFYREIPVQSVESIDLMLGRLYELGCQWPTFIEVLDLSKVERPSPAVRAVIRRWMLRLAPRMAHLCVIIETNIVMRAVARFVAYSMNVTQLSFYETEAEAIDAARRLRG